MDLIKVTPDLEKVKGILNIVKLLEDKIKIQDRDKMAALIIVDYYEVIKELLTVILLSEGYKTLSHMDLIEYAGKNLGEIEEGEYNILDNLRILRNRVSYDGFFINVSYLNDNEVDFKKIINKLKNILDNKLK